MVTRKKVQRKKKRLRQRKKTTKLYSTAIFTSCNMSFVRLGLVLHITENKRTFENCIKKFSPSANKLVTDIKVLEK